MKGTIKHNKNEKEKTFSVEVVFRDTIKSPEGFAENISSLPISIHNDPYIYEDGQEVDFEIVRENATDEEFPIYVNSAFIYTGLMPASSWEEIWKEWAEKHNETMSFLEYLINNFQIPKRK